MTDDMNKLIDAAAAAVADAELAVDDARAALAPATADRGVIASRIVDLETERTSILAARRNGHHDNETHGPRLVLIAADLDDLSAMLTEVDARIAPLRQAHDDAGRNLRAAEQVLANSREDTILRLTIARANELGELLLQAAASIDGHKVRLATSRNLWAPSKALADKLRALDLQRVPEVSQW